mgnify:CR=1 FL=1
MSHFDRPHPVLGAAHASNTRTIAPVTHHPPGSYEAQMAVRRVFAVLNPGKDFDETQARLRNQRECPDTVSSREIARANPVKVPCGVCGALIRKTNSTAAFCKPCSGLMWKMEKNVR